MLAPAPARAARGEKGSLPLTIERRPSTGIWSGLWSLPELPADADVPEALRGRFGIEAATIDALAPVVHGFTHFTLTLDVWRAQAPDGWEPEQGVWADLDDLDAYALPSVFRKVLVL